MYERGRFVNNHVVLKVGFEESEFYVMEQEILDKTK